MLTLKKTYKKNKVEVINITMKQNLWLIRVKGKFSSKDLNFQVTLYKVEAILQVLNQQEEL